DAPMGVASQAANQVLRGAPGSEHQDRIIVPTALTDAAERGVDEKPPAEQARETRQAIQQQQQAAHWSCGMQQVNGRAEHDCSLKNRLGDAKGEVTAAHGTVAVVEAVGVEEKEPDECSSGRQPE